MSKLVKHVPHIPVMTRKLAWEKLVSAAIDSMDWNLLANALNPNPEKDEIRLEPDRRGPANRPNTGPDRRAQEPIKTR